MPIEIGERYRFAIERYNRAEELRVRIIQACGLIYVGLAIAFAWTQSESGARRLSVLVPLIGIAATVLMWIADRRNRCGLEKARKIAAKIEEDACIPVEHRFFDDPSPPKRWRRMSFSIDGSAAVIVVLLAFATWYLCHNDGYLPR